MKTKSFVLEPAQRWSIPAGDDFDSEHTLVLAFGAPESSESAAVFAALAAAYPKSHLLGCSTAGEIHDVSIRDGSVSIAVCKFESTKLERITVPISNAEESFAAGERIARALQAPSLRAVFVLSDGLHVNGSQLTAGLNSVLPSEVVITGGLAGDGPRFKKTWVLDGATPKEQIIAAVGLYGDNVRVGHGSKGGWDAFGPEREVTRSNGNVLFELNGKPALDVYKEYLGSLASGLPASALLFPLALRRSNQQRTLVRTILSIDEEARSLTFAGDIPQGSSVQLMRANFDRLIAGAGEAARLTQQAGEDGDSLSIAISCVGRRLILGERTEEEVESAHECLPKGTQLVGFYSYGEISPVANGSCDLHNQTMTLTTIQER